MVIVFQYAKMQMCCLVVLAYLAATYFIGCKKYKRKLEASYYDELLILSIITVLFDGATACTVNMQDVVPRIVNLFLHFMYIFGIITMIYVLFRYLSSSVKKSPNSKVHEIHMMMPWIIGSIVELVYLNDLVFLPGNFTSYSMGVSAVACFAVAIFYIIACIVILCRSWKFIEQNKRISIITYLVTVLVCCAVQAIYPEVLMTSLGVTIIVMGVYFAQENPAYDELKRDHNTMVIGFADLVESRDRNTGGHIKRTSEYVALIVNELKVENKFTDILTEDYLENTIKAAPMHDIGKVSTPDAILTKPGKLDDEEFSIMKNHAAKGGEILATILEGMKDEDYRKIACEVARHHHEKWNGRGYPDGIKETEIPLCARIMAVADVFDAISQDRCYRAAMPLDTCFEIIKDGSGTDFDPQIVEAFCNVRDKAEKICLDHRMDSSFHHECLW